MVGVTTSRCYSRSRSLTAPLCTTPGLGDKRGGHNKLWTDEQERDFIDVVVKPCYLRQGASISNSQLATLARQHYNTNLHDPRMRRTRPAPLFLCGREWT